MADTRTFLVEIGTEELPPRALRGLMDAFREGVARGLLASALKHEGISGYASPRRLAVKVTGLAAQQPDREVEHRGPPVKIAFDADGAPTRAAAGFAANHGVQVSDLARVESDKGAWLYYRAVEAGLPAESLLPDIIEECLEALPIPRRMRWGASDVEFVRPVHWVVMLLDEAVVPARLFEIAADRHTRGHRIHGPGPLTLESAADYPEALVQAGHVIPDFDERRRAIIAQLGEAGRTAGGKPLMDDALLDEVTSLVEWPVALTGSIPEGYLSLPEEVLVATLQSHQRYFPLRGPDGKLLPKFVTISNLESTRPEQVRNGNERVVRPRLADAEFFYQADRKVALSDRLDSLGGVVFQERLGSLLDKTRRVAALARGLADDCDANPEHAQRAASLARCDLVTRMVGEFPELQGIMGRYYALADGEDAEVATAISELYRPRFSGDKLPETGPGRALSIADKADTLVGIFAIGEPPTGTRDPFGLRRSALGVLRIAIECELDIDLAPMLTRAAARLPDGVRRAGVADEVLDYMLERLRGYYLDTGATPGVTTEMFDAVLARRPTRPLDFHHRIVAVRDFMGHEAAVSLAAANKRIANILRKADVEWPQESDPSLFRDDAERLLYDAMNELTGPVTRAISGGRYATALDRLAGLRQPVDRFFDEVLVMTDDEKLRDNRLALLDTLHQLFAYTADFSRLSPS